MFLQLLLLLSDVVPLVIGDARTGDHDHHHREFEKFIRNHQRKFSNHSEKAQRLYIFKDNLVKISQLNQRYNSTGMFGVTQFADWTKDEFKKLLTDRKYLVPSNDTPTLQVMSGGSPIVGAGQSVDYRNIMTSIKNQGQCGACWSFATLGNVEALHKKATGQEVDLAEQALIDCAKESMGCNGGYPSAAYKELISNGVPEEKDYAFKGVQESCREHKAKIKIKSYATIPAGFDNIKNYLINNGPLVGTVEVPTALQHYKGTEIYKPTATECSFNVGGHAWVIAGLGYNGDEPYYIVKNSWGTTWGDQGYVKFAAGKNLCKSEEYSYAGSL